MIEQTQFPFQQNNVSKSPLIAIIFTTIIVFVLVSIILEFKRGEVKVSSSEQLNA